MKKLSDAHKFLFVFGSAFVILLGGITVAACGEDDTSEPPPTETTLPIPDLDSQGWHQTVDPYTNQTYNCYVITEWHLGPFSGGYGGGPAVWCHQYEDRP